MIEQIRVYAKLIAAIVLIVSIGYTHWRAYSHGKASGMAEVQAKFDSYRRNISDQIQKAADAAAIEKQHQDNLYAAAKFDFADASRNLDIALKRLRDLKTVPGNASVPVAGSGSGSVPTETKDTAGTDQATIAEAGIRSTPFYAAAMSDTLQCSKLIEFVTKD